MSTVKIYDEPQVELTILENGTPITLVIGGGSLLWGQINGNLSDQTDLQNALNAKVPYSGATGNVNLGEYGISTGYVQLDTTPTTYTPAVGNLGYNDTTGTLETTLKGGNVQLKIGRDMFERVVNKTGVQLTKAAYQAVRVSDAQGQRLAVALAQANNDNNSADTIGLVVETIDNNQEGNIYTVGEITGINTTGSLQGETWADGDVLYLSPTTAGTITNVKPVAPQHLVVIGYVVYAHQNNGKIYIKIMNGWELGELHDVNTTGATAGQVLKYNGTIWAPSADAGVTGSGIAGQVAYWNSPSTITSNFKLSFSDSTGLLGINTFTPSYRVNAVGTASTNNGFVASELLGREIGIFSSRSTTGQAALSVISNHALTFETVGTERARLTTTGNLLLGTTTDLASSILTMDSTTKGFLRPRMTTVQRDAIVSPSTGLSVYNTTTNKVNYYNGTAWTEIQDTITNPVTGTGTSGQVAYWNGTTTQTGSNNLFWDNANGRLGIGTNTPSFALQVQSDAQVNGLRIGKGPNNISTNTVLGVLGLNNITSGTNNTAVGNGALSQITTSSDNTALGQGALEQNTSDSNTAIGRAALPNITSSSQENTALGKHAGRYINSGSNLTSSLQSVFLGFDARANSNSETNQIVIGYQGRGLGSNTSVIGNSSTTFGRWWGNLLIGSSVNSGQALQVTGDTLLKGSGATSATNGLIVQDSNSRNVLQAGNDGTILIGNLISSNNRIYFGDSNYVIGRSDAGYRFQSSRFATTALYHFDSGAGLAITSTSGTSRVLYSNISFAPTSGTGILNYQELIPTINQTGGANGITRGLYVNPTLTAAADWRSIEWSNNTGWGLYGAGTANNYLAGSLGIGTTSLANGRRLVVSGTSTGSTVVYPFLINPTIATDVTGTAAIVYNAPNLAASGTYNNLQNFVADFSSLGAGSTVALHIGYLAASNMTASNATNIYGFQGGIPSGAGRWNLYMNGTALNYLNGNLLLGTTTDAGFKLDVNGTARITPPADSVGLTISGYSVTGSGSSSIINLSGTWNTTANVNGLNIDITNTASGINSSLINCTLNGTTTIFNAKKSGEVGVGNTLSFVSSNGLILGTSSLTIATASTQQSGLLLNKTASVNATSGYYPTVSVNSTANSFAPTSGTATFTSLQVIPTINQTGGANGITRGLYVNPTLTAAADWRSIEWSNSTGWGLYGAGTANNYLAGSLGIGTTSLTGANLKISKNITGATISSGIENAGTIQSDVTNIAIGVNSGLTVANSSFTINSVRQFLAQSGGIGASAIVNNQSGFHVNATLIGATNNYGFYGDIASGTGRWNLYMNGTALNYLNGSLLIGTTTDAGFKLDVNGTARITPPANSVGLTLSGYSLTGSNAQSAVDISGTWNTTGTPTLIKANVTNTASNSASNLIDLQVDNISYFRVRRDGFTVLSGLTAGSANITGDFGFQGGFGIRSATSGNVSLYRTSDNFIPTSGTATYSTFLSTVTINQTGGANGITRGLYINPTLTAAADWRSIETSNNTGYALYLGGSADAFFNDATDFQFGTTTGTKIGTATSQKLGFWNATPIVQPTTGVASATRVGGGGTTLTDTDTFDGYTLAQIVKALRNTGILA